MTDQEALGWLQNEIERSVNSNIFGMGIKSSPFLRQNEVILENGSEMLIINTNTGKGFGIRKDALTLGDLDDAEVLVESTRSPKDLAREVLRLRRERSRLERLNKSQAEDHHRMMERLQAAEARIAEMEGRQHSPSLGGSRSPE